LTLLDQGLYTLLHDTSGAGTPPSAAAAPDDLNALAAAEGLRVPQWSHHAMRAAIVLATLVLLFALPAMGAPVAVLGTALTGAGLVASQAALALYSLLWLPLGHVVIFLLAGLTIMLFWMQPQREIITLRDNVRQARFQLGRLLMQQGQPDEALAALESCPPDHETLTLQYDIAIVQERKRQYERAIQTYEQILARKKRFRDVSDRLAALQHLTANLSPGTGTNHEDARTLVMPNQTVTRPTLGRYEIERELGRGAMGVVYLGKDPKIARTVAIKTLSYDQFEAAQLRELKDRFFREAEAAGRLNHPAIVTVYDVGEEADLAFIAMDYAHGKPLSAFSTPKKRLPLATVLNLVAQTADALEYAHGKKIIHRDIKPGNLIYNPANGDLKITDFGIAKIADDSRTRTGTVMGSPLYMSPEQLKGQKVSPASDTYSLGITLYKLVSGETPFSADTLANLTYQILNKRPRSVREFEPELPEPVVRLINKAIQREPQKRFTSAGAMAQAARRLANRYTSQEAS
jgi:serine/threonine-protein kinase